MMGIEQKALSILSEIIQVAHSKRSLRECLQTIVDIIAGQMQKDVCSICLLDPDRETLVLKASRGLAPEAIERVTLRLGEGVIGWVALQREPLALPDAQKDPRFKYFPETREERYQSMLAVPILCQDQCIGVLSVRTAERHEFSQEEILLLSTIARVVGGVIHSAQIYEELHQGFRELATLYEIAQALTSTLDLDTVLQMILKNSLGVLKARGGVLRLLDSESGLLVVRARSVPEEDQEKLQPVQIGEGISGWIAERGEPLLIEDLSRSPFSQASPVASRTVIGVPLRVRDRIIGTLTFYDKQEKETPFTKHDLQLLSTLASQAAMAIENAQWFAQAQRQAREMETLYSLTRGVTSTLDLDFVLYSALRLIGETLEVEFGFLFLVDETTGELVLRATWGKEVSPPVPEIRVRMGEGTTGQIAAQTRGLRWEAVPEEDPKRPFYPLQDLMGVPLMAKERIIGVLEVANRRREGGFSESDLLLLSTFAGQAAVAIENANLYQKTRRLAEENEKRVRELTVLYEIGNLLQTTLELPRLLRIILTGVTIGGGLGFNRALLFLVDEDRQELYGVMGVGPDSPEEARRIWASIPTQGTLRDRILALQEQSEDEESHLNRLARSVRIPIVEGGGILALTVLERRPFLIPDARTEPRVNPVLRETLGTESFATAPLIARDRVVGAIFVDNYITRKPITEDDVRFLMMFAQQAGKAIENAQIYTSLEETNRNLREAQERLVQQEKLAALGEMATSIAHEIRNPLVAIGGFARRLQNRKEADEVVRRYAAIIYQEVERLEKILKDILRFARDTTPNRIPIQMNQIIQDVLGLMREQLNNQGIQVYTELDPTLPLIQADPEQIRQVCLNLFYNALDAMGPGGELYIHTRMVHEPTWSIQVEVSDTGPGIPREILANIFNPFFTTKPNGTGLGLAIVHRIVTSHGGQILVRNRTEGGATFLITFPVRIQ